MATLVPRQRHIPSKWSVPITKSWGNDISQNSAQGGNSPAQASAWKCCFNMIPGGWSEPQREQGETHSKGNDQSLGQQVSSGGMQISTAIPQKVPAPRERGCCRMGLVPSLPSPIPAYLNLGADSSGRKCKAGRRMANRHNQDGKQPGARGGGVGPQAQAAVLRSRSRADARAYFTLTALASFRKQLSGPGTEVSSQGGEQRLSLTEGARGCLQTCPLLVSDKQLRSTSQLCTDEKEEGKNSKAGWRLF